MDTGRQFSTVEQLRINRNIGIFRIHILHTGDAERCRMGERTFNCVQALLMGERRDDFVDIVHGSVFQSAGGIALRIADDGSAGWVWGFGRDPCHAQRHRVGQRHVAVVSIHEYRQFGGYGIDELFGRELGRVPLGFVPIAAKNPLVLLCIFGTLANATGEFFRGCRIVQLNTIELRSSAHEVDVSIVEARQKRFAAGIDDASLRTTPGSDLRIRSDGYYSITEHGDGLGRGE